MSDTTETRVTLSKRELHELRTALGAWVNAYNLMEDYLGMPEECITYDENPREGYISATEADALGEASAKAHEDAEAFTERAFRILSDALKETK
jgi:hypothetical protein